MSTNKYNIPAYSQGVSALFTGTSQIGHIDAAPSGQANWNKPDIHIEEEEEFSALSTTIQDWDKEIKFEITQNFDKMGKTHFVYTRSAVTQDSTDKFRFHDWEPIATIKKIEFKYNNKIFHTVYQHEMFFDIVNRTPKNKKNRLAEELSGFTSEAERLTLATAAQTYRVPLNVPWSFVSKQLPQRALPVKIEVSVFFNKFIDCGYTTTNAATYSNSSATLSGMKFVVEGEHKRAAMKQQLIEMGMRGLDYKVWDWELQEDIAIGSGTTEKVVDLDQIKNDSPYIVFTIRPTAKVPNGTQSNATNPWYFVKCSSYYIKDGQKKLHDEFITADWDTHRVHEMFPFAPVPNPYHFINFCPRHLMEASDFECYGSRAMVHYNKPQLVVKFASATPEAYRLDIYAKIHQILRMKEGGVRILLGV